MELYITFIPSACAKGIVGFSLPMCDKTALKFALLDSINSLHLLATWSVPNSSNNVVTFRAIAYPIFKLVK